MLDKRQVMALIQGGQWSKAKEACSLWCQENPNDPEGWFLLGAINGQLGAFDEAETCSRRVIAISPVVPIAHYNLGIALQKLEKTDEALKSFQQAVRLKPDFPEAYCELGVAFQSAGRLESAIENYQKALALNPGLAAAHYNLGAALREIDRLGEAADSCNRALVINPGMAEAHRTLGLILGNQGQFTQAEACFEQVLRIQPNHAEACIELGNILKSQGKIKKALSHYRRAIQIKPNDVAGRNAAGLALMELNQFDVAEACFREVLKLQPDSAEAHNNLAGVMMLQGRIEDATRHYQRAIDLKPDVADTYINMGIALLQQRGKIGEAIKLHQAALEMNPHHAELHNSLGALMQLVAKFDSAIAHYRQALQIQPTLIHAQRNLATLYNYDHRFEPEEIFNEHVRFGQALASAITDTLLPNTNVPDPERRLRIGYVSPDLRSHSVAYFLEPLLASHDKTLVETICYSDAQVADGMTAHLRKLAHKWRDTYNVADMKVADWIREDGIDILVDLAGYTFNNRLPVFARKPAPVQVTYLGYPNTTGLPAVDYRLTDAWADPPGVTERFHTETLVHLPHGFLCYLPPVDAPEVVALPARTTNYISFGSFNNLSKVTSQVVELWASILRAIPHSRLVLKNDSLGDEKTRDNYYALFADQGIARERVDFLGSLPSVREHLAVYGQIDIALDPFPYNGTTTTCEALWMGVPVITLAGRTHAGRVGVSLLSRVGLAECIAPDPQGYVDIATELASDIPRLTKLRASLRAIVASSSLCDAPAFARDVEVAYRHMWHTWCGNLDA